MRKRGAHTTSWGERGSVVTMVEIEKGSKQNSLEYGERIPQSIFIPITLATSSDRYDRWLHESNKQFSMYLCPFFDTVTLTRGSSNSLSLQAELTERLGEYCSNITDYFSTLKITTSWRRNTHTHTGIQNKDALTKARMPYVILKPTEHTNTNNNSILQICLVLIRT